jgi:N-acetylneuraminate 9-O-acetyltransferase
MAKSKKYHYYRATNVYNIIRVFVSSYVWMTGFGNFLYFDKKQDFSVERAISMWLRINYFPLLLSIFVGVPFELLYIVPLHTTAFFITMITCYVAKGFETTFGMSHWQKNCSALSLCVLVHVVFYETPMVNLLEYFFGHEIYFRFSSDKYSAVLGIVSGYFWHIAQSYVTWANTPMTTTATTTMALLNHPTTTLPTTETTPESEKSMNGAKPVVSSSSSSLADAQQLTSEQTMAIYGQRLIGLVMILVWWFLFGHINDKFTYNPIHPIVFWLPVFGWLMIRNSSKYLTELHSTALEFFGKITLETYVLQFHVFMCRNVQYIPIVLPNSGPDGNAIMKFLNMLLTGIGFVALAYWARQITVTTQTTVTDLIVLLLNRNSTTTASTMTHRNLVDDSKSTVSALEKVPLTTSTMGDEESHNTIAMSDNGNHLK